MCCRKLGNTNDFQRNGMNFGLRLGEYGNVGRGYLTVHIKENKKLLISNIKKYYQEKLKNGERIFFGPDIDEINN